jgi:hypothetical protein
MQATAHYNALNARSSAGCQHSRYQHDAHSQPLMPCETSTTLQQLMMNTSMHITACMSCLKASLLVASPAFAQRQFRSIGGLLHNL